MASLIKNMAEPFSATKEYEYGQNVTFQKQPYQRINPLTGSGPWNADDWKPLFLTDMTSGNTVEGDNCLYVAPEYDPEQEEPYNTDDTVLHLGLLHKCKEDNVSGPWDESKWERILLTDVGDLPSSLGDFDISKATAIQGVGENYRGSNMSYGFKLNKGTHNILVARLFSEGGPSTFNPRIGFYGLSGNNNSTLTLSNCTILNKTSIGSLTLFKVNVSADNTTVNLTATGIGSDSTYSQNFYIYYD